MAEDRSNKSESPEGAGVSIGNVYGDIQKSIIAGRDVIFNIQHPRLVRDRQNLLKLLNRVKAFWVEGVLEHSIHKAALIQLGKAAHPTGMKHPWAAMLEQPTGPSERLAPSKGTLEIFDEMQQALLILGEPGSGKTITLLELARDAIVRAQGDTNQPVPVVLNLSSWSEKSPSLADWVVAELISKYQIPERIGREWIEEDSLILLLDGLDEVEPASRKKCVDAINHFLRERMTGVAVCSRMADYLALGIKLKLQGAIRLEPLERKQIEQYFADAGPALAGLHAALQDDTALQELAKSPLMLSVITLAYGNIPPGTLSIGHPKCSGDLRMHILGAYVNKMMRWRRMPREPRYAPQKTLEGLAWLAKKMARRNQSIFLIESLQPDWLEHPIQRALYALSVALIAAFVIATALLVPLVGSRLRAPVNWTTVWAFSLIATVGCIGAAITALEPDGWRLVEHGSSGSNFRAQKIKEVLGTGSTASLGFALSIVILRWFGMPLADWVMLLARDIAPSPWGLVALAILIASTFGLLFGFRRIHSGSALNIQTAQVLAWSWKGFLFPVVIGLLVSAVTFVVTVFIRSPGTVLLDERQHQMSYLKGKHGKFNRDGTRIVTNDDGGTWLWNGNTGQLIASLPVVTDSTSLEFSPDGRIIATRRYFDNDLGQYGLLSLWDSGQGTRLATIRIPGNEEDHSLFFSPDWTRVFVLDRSADEDGSGLWNVTTGTRITTIQHVQDARHPPTFNQSGTRLAILTDAHKYQLWNSANGSLVASLSPKGELAFTPDGLRFVTLEPDGHAQLWNSEDGIFVKELETHVRDSDSIEFSSDSKRLLTISQDGVARLWDGRSGDLAATVEGGPNIPQHGPVKLNLQATRVLWISEDGTAWLWETTTGHVISHRNVGHTWHFRFSPDGTRFVTLDQNGSSTLWNSETGNLIAALDSRGTSAWLSGESKFLGNYPVFCPDGSRLATVRQDGTVRLWNGTTGALVGTLKERFDDAPEKFSDAEMQQQAFVFSGDCSRLAFLHNDNLIKMRVVSFWDTNTAKLLAGMFHVFEVRFGMDGKRALANTTVKERDYRALSPIPLWVGLFFGLFLGLGRGVKGGKTFPNEGIWLSAKSAVVMGVIGGMALSVLTISAFLLFNPGLRPSAYGILLVVGFFAPLCALWYGGLDFTQHFILRILLRFTHPMPLNLPRFLDHAANCILLHRVGAGYLFVHPLLLEYFAGLS